MYLNPVWRRRDFRGYTGAKGGHRMGIRGAGIGIRIKPAPRPTTRRPAATTSAAAIPPTAGTSSAAGASHVDQDGRLRFPGLYDVLGHEFQNGIMGVKFGCAFQENLDGETNLFAYLI